jgi:hypothetical protein
MDLFAVAGIDLPRSGLARRRPAAPRSLPTPLFAYKVVEEAIGRSGFAPDEALLKTARDYARKVRGLKAAKEKTFRPVFIDEVLIKILGYSRIDPDKPYTLADEQTLGTGSVDTALGRFEVGGVGKVLAPFELKGPDTKDLDRIMPGRGKTPVQQAWEYANDAPGAKWVLVSNCVWRPSLESSAADTSKRKRSMSSNSLSQRWMLPAAPVSPPSVRPAQTRRASASTFNPTSAAASSISRRPSAPSGAASCTTGTSSTSRPSALR